jgi:hypothetical protein
MSKSNPKRYVSGLRFRMLGHRVTGRLGTQAAEGLRSLRETREELVHDHWNTVYVGKLLSLYEPEPSASLIMQIERDIRGATPHALMSDPCFTSFANTSVETDHRIPDEVVVPFPGGDSATGTNDLLIDQPVPAHAGVG